MPGNELGDGVHNFFAQENSSQGQNHPPQGNNNWPLLGNNFLVGGQRQSDVSNSKNFNHQNPDGDRGGPNGYPYHAVHGMNFHQSNLRPDFNKPQPPAEQATLNGFMYGNQFNQTRQSEARFQTPDRDSDQRHLRGSSVHELQQGSPDHRTKSSGEAEISVSFDLFSGQQQQQQQTNHLQWQNLSRQQSGIGDMQQQHQLQQQYMIRKMQEVQMQQQQQNMINQAPHFTKKTLNSGTLQYPWTADIGANWTNQGSPTMQGSANGLVSPSNVGQSRQSLNMGSQQADQSLYGVPVSGSGGLNVNEYSSYMMRDRPSLPQTPMSSHTRHGNQHNLSSVQVGAAEGSSRQKFQNIGGHQQVNNFILRNALPQQVSAARTEALREIPAPQVATSQKEIGLDPTEEKILFGSDDNIWAAFGSGEAGNSYDHAGSSKGLPSVTCGSWSALMQSAVAETSSSDAIPQDEWSGLVLNSNNDSNKPEASFVDNNSRLPSDFSSRSVSSFDINAHSVAGSNQFRQKSENEPGHKMHLDLAGAQSITGQQQNVWNSVLAGGDRVQNNHEKLAENSESNQLRVMQREVYRGSSLRKSNSGSSSMELVPGEATSRNLQTNRGILTLNDASSLSLPSNVGIGGDEKHSQFFQNNNSALLNNWKNVSVSNQVNDPSQVADSLNNQDEEEGAKLEMDIHDKNENSSGSYHSNLPQHNFGGFRENGLSNANAPQTLSFANQKSNNQLTRKESVPRKFQFHPMGNLDENVEPTYDPKYPNSTQAVPHQNCSQGLESNYFGQAPRMGKVQPSQLQSKNSDVISRHSKSGNAPAVSVPFNQVFDAYASNRGVSSTSQNMLELLNKVDQSADQSAMMQLNSSKLPESDKFDGAGGLKRSQSSVSQGFGLQLGPPSQSKQTARVSGQMQMQHQIDSSIGIALCSEQRRFDENVVPNTSANTQEDNLASSACIGQHLTPNDANERFSKSTTQTTNHMQASQNYSAHGISQQQDSSLKSQAVWTNVPTQLRKYGSSDFNMASSHYQESLQPNIVESSASFMNQGYANSQGSVDGKGLMLDEISGRPRSTIGIEPDPKMKGSSGSSPANSASALNDIKTFGHSLKHNSSSNQNYSVVNQMQDAETDANNRASKRVKGSDNNFDVHHEPGASAEVAFDSSSMLCFSKSPGILPRSASQLGNVPSQDVSSRVDHPQVSPQMAPSWFNQYGNFRNGPMHELPKLANVKPGEPPVGNHGKPTRDFDMANPEEKAPLATSLLDARRVENSKLSSTVETRVLSSQLNLTNQQHMKTLSPLKKHTATSELLPWHTNIVSTEASQSVWSPSVAERNWSTAVNCLTEKDENGAAGIDDKELMLRPRRRLKLTTRLMQQLFPPAPPAILSGDATSDFESVAYVVCRTALGDACSSLASISADTDVSPNNPDVLSVKGNLSGAHGDQRSAKVVEELTERARKLENDFLRLDKSASVIDLKVDGQDVEKFGVINRFARFHGRGQSDVAESTSADVTQKPVPQRYVTALQAPKSLPDSVQCLSL